MSADTANLRAEERTSLFIMSTLVHASGQVPVKLRNISATGAFLDGAGIPAVGSAIELRRGAQSATGHVMWRDGPRAGVHFTQATDVDSWLPTASPQRVVDQTIETFRGGGANPAAPLHASYISSEEMEKVASLLDDLADALSNDAGVLFNYALKLQALDIGAQMLRKLAHGSRQAA